MWNQIPSLKSVASDAEKKLKASHGNMPNRASGLYWFYTLDSEGNRLESTPGICQYCNDTNKVMLIGYDVPMEYDHDRYELIAKAVWAEKVENCETCNGEGSPMGCRECGA